MMLRNHLRSLYVLALVATGGVYACSSDSDPVGAVDEQKASDAGPGSTIPGSSDAGGSTTPDATPPGSVPDSAPLGFTCPGGTINPGLNEGFEVAGKKRKFYADFPTDTSKPPAVMFSWHGFGDNADNFHKLAFDPNLDPNVPVVIVTAEATGLLPPSGLGWAIAKGKPDEANIDIALFEAVLGCLQAQQKIDTSRIYEFGFSAGSVMTNLIYSRYPKVVAAVVTESGAWMNDAAQRKLVSIPVPWSWPDLDPADRGNVLLTHGGKKDVTDLNILDLEKSAQLAFPFLKAAQRTVVDCPHEGGHTLHQELLQRLIMKYLLSHRLGAPSPHAGGGGLEGYPASCKVLVP